MDMMSKLPSVPAPATAKPAKALHNRLKSEHVVDLRHPVQAKPVATSEPELPIQKAHHITPLTSKGDLNERHIAQFTDKFEKARKYSRSEQISRFDTDPLAQVRDPEKLHDKFGNPTLELLEQSEPTKPSVSSQSGTYTPIAPPAHAPELPHITALQHQAMTRLALAPAKDLSPAGVNRPLSWLPHFRISQHRRRSLATISIIIVMAGYVWVQNYPKMALQNANNQAGLSASLPGFMPSSYSLSQTTTGPGQITLSYSSPNTGSDLKIAQSRSTWDSSSLLDNFVAKNADDYAAVQGEGLTIYLFDNNEATWVNHGIWYNIEGASLLSRAQILKIAYSL
jgi:hypothetical protein